MKEEQEIMYKLFLVLWLVMAGNLALGYARYVHDDENNKAGAFAVFALVILAAGAVYMA